MFAFIHFNDTIQSDPRCHSPFPFPLTLQSCHLQCSASECFSALQFAQRSDLDHPDANGALHIKMPWFVIVPSIPM